MDQAYFCHVRKDIEPLLPARASRILDIGAGAGFTSAWLRLRYPGSHVMAVEGNGLMRDLLQQNADEVVIADITQGLPELGSPDLVLLLDVLEHVADPAAVLGRVVSALAPNGVVVVSCPNIAHLSVALPLALRARFEYQDSGILDRTHLRFFVRESVVGLLNDQGLIVERGVRAGMGGVRTRLLDSLTLGRMRDHLTKQYIVLGKQPGPGHTQGAIEWLTF
jgi:SAM-dependent methyltransferase